jgi:hypothetical protein
MKKSIATVISVAGVLGAGAAAYAVNTSVLSATSSNDLVVATAPADTFADLVAPMAPGAVAAAGSPTTAAAPLVPTAPSQPATPVATTAPAPLIAPVMVAPLSSTPVATSSLTTYKVGTVGSVVLDTADGRLSIVSATPAAGWTARKLTPSATSSKVVFTSSTMTVTFDATLANGSVSTNVTSAAVTPPVVVRPPRQDDDGDHDDDHEDHENDDDHDEEDD